MVSFHEMRFQPSGRARFVFRTDVLKGSSAHQTITTRCTFADRHLEQILPTSKKSIIDNFPNLVAHDVVVIDFSFGTHFDIWNNETLSRYKKLCEANKNSRSLYESECFFVPRFFSFLANANCEKRENAHVQQTTQHNR